MRSDPVGFIRTNLHNGVGRYVCQLQRITFRFCKEFMDSKGMRHFIEMDLLDFARQNPGIAVYLQPKRHQSPKLHCEFLNGRKEDFRVGNFSREEIIKWVEYMRTRSGFEVVKVNKLQMTEHPSIQGPWTPFTNQPTEWNLLKFPNNDLFRYRDGEKSATEIILELAEKHGIRNVNVAKGDALEEKSDGAKEIAV